MKGTGLEALRTLTVFLMIDAGDLDWFLFCVEVTGDKLYGEGETPLDLGFVLLCWSLFFEEAFTGAMGLAFKDVVGFVTAPEFFLGCVETGIGLVLTGLGRLPFI